MKLKVTITMDNAAFQDDYAGSECGRILRETADKLDGREMCSTGVLFPLIDANGNKVGEAKVTR